MSAARCSILNGAVKTMIEAAETRGFVSYADSNAVLPSAEVGSEQVEAMLAMLNAMGIDVIVAEEADSDEAA